MIAPAALDRINRRKALLIGVAFAAVGSTSVRAQERRSFDMEIKGGQVAADTNTIRVTEGDDVEISWASDRPAQLHLHGYDVQVSVTPEAPSVMAFRAHTAGRFPVSDHATAHGAAHGVLIYLEIYPR